VIGGEALRPRLSELARVRRVHVSDAGGAPNRSQTVGLESGPLRGLPPAPAPLHPVAAPPSLASRRSSDAPPSSPTASSLRALPDPSSALAHRSPFAVGVEAFLPGGEWRDDRGAVFVHERLRSQIETPRSDWGRLREAPPDEEELATFRSVGLEKALFLDLETGGLISSPVFLAGTMRWNGSDFVVRQYFARHYGEEAALLRALAEETSAYDALVTFNGKSYDVPFLRDRARLHGVNLAVPPIHLDLLHASRRKWKGRLVDCRLQTLERCVCRRRRFGDVAGADVPGLYHDFVRRGDPYRLIPVFHHNMLDVITMYEILRALYGARSLAEGVSVEVDITSFQGDVPEWQVR
jgi:uncharacterized protein YprB with RNaseH-like and TPR domain